MFHWTQLNAKTRNYLKDLKDLTYAQRSTNNWSWLLKTKVEDNTFDFQDLLSSEPQQEEQIGEEKEEGQPELQSPVRGESVWLCRKQQT